MTILLGVGIPLVLSGGVAGYYFIKKKMKESLVSNAILNFEDLESEQPYIRKV